ncbi:MAG: TonB-dependent siderophore receptor [Reyranella sp.]|uniref:TonB-dependent receptor n=1 Tax=Reyranella sp. TaxID=1929291 RepID=UPI0012196972|nr:TonB-dependent receptor [Reyranella sp.]TAJ88486.1 MAG: TonB-dependent siderophore receptor [Reyranella sp.]TBR30286.1 MAG: TonB-dependent siderophore receptor [Reyranella sp.]
MTLGICAALLAGVGSPARSQEAPAIDEAQAPPSVAFDIASQPLASALMTFGRQAGLQVAVDPAAVAGRTSAAVRGSMTVDQALQQLLAGTRLAFQFTGSSSIQIRSSGAASGAITLDPVQVQGVFAVPSQAMIDNLPPVYAGGQVATGGQLGLLGNRDVMNTPFNQTNYTAKKAQDQQATTVRDVLVDDPSVRVTNPAGGFAAEGVTIRGFDVNNQEISYGGLYGMLPLSSIMAELAERVEVLKGPSVMLNGMPPLGGIGGTINVVPKRAPAEPLTQLSASYNSATQFGGHADVGRRFGADKQFGIRVNGVFRAGQTAIEETTDKRGLGVLGLDFRGERVRLSADFGYQYQYIGGVIPQLGLADGIPLPWAPNARTNQGQPWSYQERNDLFGVVRGEVDLTERITAYAAFGAHDYRATGLDDYRVTVTNFNGAAATGGVESFSEQWTALTAEAGIRALFNTGPLNHELAVTATTLSRETSFGWGGGAPLDTNIYNPIRYARPDLAIPAATKSSTQGRSSLGFADTVSAAEKRVQLTVGARLQRVTAANFDSTTGAQTSSYDQSALSPSVALVFKPWENVSIYGNWIQGLQQGFVVPVGFTNADEIFPPFKSTQYEVGIKVDWGKFTTTASIFQISRPFALVNLAANTMFVGGEQRNQGLELNVFGEPIKGVRMLGGAMFLNPVLTKTQDGLTDGWVAPLVPQVNLNLSAEWDLPFAPGLTVDGRVIYTGSQYVDTTWPRRILPAWTRFDIGGRYTFENPGAKGKLLVARFNVENLLDANYWLGGTSVVGLMLGQPRTFRLSLTADF